MLENNHNASYETIIALIGSVSCGKSSFLNTAICRYPIFPVSQITTSVCVTELRRAESQGVERIEVCLFSDDKKALKKDPVRVFAKEIFDEKLFERLYNYAVFLSENLSFEEDNLLRFFGKKHSKISLDRKNWRHCMVLLMILLDTYVRQDKQEEENITELYDKLNRERNSILEELDIPIKTDFGLRLYWDSDKIPKNTVLTDITRKYSEINSTAGSKEHKELTEKAFIENYLEKVSSVICFMDDIIDEECAFILKMYSDICSSENISFVISKNDIYYGEYTDYRTDITKIYTPDFRRSFPQFNNYPVYSFSSFDSEWLLLDSDISLDRLHSIDPGADLNDASMVGKLKDELLSRFSRKYILQLREGQDFLETDYFGLIGALLAGPDKGSYSIYSEETRN